MQAKAIQYNSTVWEAGSAVSALENYATGKL